MKKGSGKMKSCSNCGSHMLLETCYVCHKETCYKCKLPKGCISCAPIEMTIMNKKPIMFYEFNNNTPLEVPLGKDYRQVINEIVTQLKYVGAFLKSYGMWEDAIKQLDKKSNEELVQLALKRLAGDPTKIKVGDTVEIWADFTFIEYGKVVEIDSLVITLEDKDTYSIRDGHYVDYEYDFGEERFIRLPDSDINPEDFKEVKNDI